MRIFFSVGEPSGDQHAAHLIAELRRRVPGFEALGFGGPLMEAAGCRLTYRMTDLAIMGIFRVIPMLLTFWRLHRQACRLRIGDHRTAASTLHLAVRLDQKPQLLAGGHAFADGRRVEVLALSDKARGCRRCLSSSYSS